MTKEEIKEFLSGTKMYVNGKSKEIQEKLFSLGYTWADGDRKVQYTDKPFLFIDKEGEISYTDDMVWFTNDSSREITAEQVLSLEPVKSYRPFKDGNECWQEMLKHQPFGWVYRRSRYLQTLAIGTGGLRFADFFCTFEQAVDSTFPDGTPFGVEE